METRDNAAELAFVESMRRQALRIVTLCMTGKAEKAAESALALCSDTARRRRELLGLPEPAFVDVDEEAEGVQADYDLQDFNAQFRQEPDGPND